MRYLKSEMIAGKRIGFMRGRAGITSAYLLKSDTESEYLWGSGNKRDLKKKVKNMLEYI